NWKLLFVSHISSSTALAQVFPTTPAIHYRPIYMLWLMVTSKLTGVSTPWLHLFCLLLHLIVVVLVYKLAQRMFVAPWAAALCALLFAFHPIHVESVAYISASADILMAFFFLTSCLCYLRFREGGSTAWWIPSILFAALAMLSKENGAMIPWALVAYECFGKNSR